MTTIVVAALALLVLVVLTLIFTGRLGGFDFSGYQFFDPEHHVCSAWTCKYSKNDFGLQPPNLLGQDYCADLITAKLIEAKCTNWRDKSVCDVDPGADGCVCDEWHNDTMECLVNGSFDFHNKVHNITYTLVISAENTTDNCFIPDSINYTISTYSDGDYLDTLVKINFINIHNRTLYRKCVKAHMEE